MPLPTQRIDRCPPTCIVLNPLSINHVIVSGNKGAGTPRYPTTPGVAIGMSVYDPACGGYRVFIGALGASTGKGHLIKDLQKYGKVLDLWLAR